MAERLQCIIGHIDSRRVCLAQQPSAALSNSIDKPDDIVIVSALRTPIGKAKRGSFKDTYPDDLLAVVLKAVIKDAKLNPIEIDDICVGNVNDPKSAISARLAQVHCGIPDSVPCYTTNRQCSSGLIACMNVAANIKSGFYNIGIGAGVESMSMYAMGLGDWKPNPKMAESKEGMDLTIPMGITSENVAARFNVSRQDQDQFALSSQLKAKRARDEGLFDAEIVPVTTTVKDQNDEEKTVTVTKDEGIRPTTIENLQKLKPAFKQNGTTTAGLTVNDVDVFEINEAFASQCLYSARELGIPLEKLNPKGGAIALGHPLGCTGARQIATLLHELKRRGRRSRGVVSMCIGTGMGAAAVFEYPGQA
ncbi:3-ketoacyl-CoA thiolase, peroxisomal [Elysia marginata]|uniref:3-ketoacyl-CoA thiolase, peroxisomal n=1 Tax=Elysia marginata TaxID=1093978 RepID=A0AAV4JPR6_9GAST|nr:3-ketoacyl-CoA thiolase, peroxisomal [Elysia marginata]